MIKTAYLLLFIGIAPMIIMPIVGAGELYEVYKFFASAIFQVICIMGGLFLLTKK